MLATAYSRTVGISTAVVAVCCLVGAAGFQILGSQPLGLLLVGLTGVNAILAADHLVWHGGHRRVTTPLLLGLVGVVVVAAAWLTVSELT